MTTPTVTEFKRWAQQHRALAQEVLHTQTIAELESERVAAYILPVFRSFTWPAGMKSFPINEPKDVYLCEDEELCTRYFEACDRAHREHGFTGPHGNCPALIADNERRKAEQQLINAWKKLFGVEGSPGVHGETREKLLKLLLDSCLHGEKQQRRLVAVR